MNRLNIELKTKFQDYKGMYLFGSFSNEKQNASSDIDIAILFGRMPDQDFEDEVTKIVYKYDIEYNVIIDNHIFNFNDFEVKSNIIYKEIELNGKFI